MKETTERSVIVNIFLCGSYVYATSYFGYIVVIRIVAEMDSVVTLYMTHVCIRLYH